MRPRSYRERPADGILAASPGGRAMFPALTFAALGLIPLPAPKPDPVRAAAAKAIPLLVKGAEGHVEKRSCFACHNQAFPVMALAAAKARGFGVTDERFQIQAEHITEFLSQNRE